MKLTEKSKAYIEAELDSVRAEVTRQTQHITAIEKEKDRYHTLPPVICINNIIF